MNINEAKSAQNSCLLNTKIIGDSRVLVVGAGGLGCNVLVHLAGAGVGKIGICDFDTVSEGNFNRQFLYTYKDVGSCKCSVAAKRLSLFAPDTQLVPVCKRVDEKNAAALIADYDLIVSACDNFAVRLALNRACVEKRLPLLDAGIAGAHGNIYLYLPEKTACLACFLQGASESGDKRTISAVAGVVGAQAAMLALHFLSGGGHGDAGKLIVMDIQSKHTDILPVNPSGTCKICGGGTNG